VWFFSQGNLKYWKAILPAAQLEDDGQSGDEKGDELSVGRLVRLVAPPLQNEAFGGDPDKL
jgi:hypothetical protein